MNAPMILSRDSLRLADLSDRDEAARIEAFVAGHPQGTVFHRPVWQQAVAQGTGNVALALICERGLEIGAYLPLMEIHSPVFGRVLASSGFAVGGGVLQTRDADGDALIAAAEELAQRRSCPTIELRGGPIPFGRAGWAARDGSHCGFAGDLASDDEAQLTAIPRKQRAEVRKSLNGDLTVHTGRDRQDRDAHYAVYAESVRNLGTPVFPRTLFEAVLDGLGEDADILTVRHRGAPVASVLSLYHCGAVLPYWGGGTWNARGLRANERMYYELMLHARRRGCTRFDFGRSKTGSGPFHFKKNWGFEPEPLHYASWTAPGSPVRDANPDSAKLALQVAIWRRLPLGIANRLGPPIARGLGLMGEILFLSHRIPFPPDRGDKIRSHHILSRLARLAPVHVATFADDDFDQAEEATLAKIAASFRLVRRSKPLALAGLEALASGKPVSLTAFHDRALRDFVDEVLATRPISAIYVFSGQMGQYVPGDFKGRVIVDFVDADSAKFEAYSLKKRGPRGWIDAREARVLCREEARLARRADVSLLISQGERDLFVSRLPADLRDSLDVQVMPNGIDSDAFAPGAATADPALQAITGPKVIFTGQMDYAPNVDAAQRAMQSIMPLVRQEIRDATFHVVGRNPPAALRKGPCRGGELRLGPGSGHAAVAGRIGSCAGAAGYRARRSEQGAGSDGHGAASRPDIGRGDGNRRSRRRAFPHWR